MAAAAGSCGGGGPNKTVTAAGARGSAATTAAAAAAAAGGRAAAVIAAIAAADSMRRDFSECGHLMRRRKIEKESTAALAGAVLCVARCVLVGWHWGGCQCMCQL